MYLLIVYIFCIMLSFILKKSKIVTGIDFILMWIMSGWSFGNADYVVYVTRYYHPERYPTLEQLYSFLQDLAKASNLKYADFLIIMTFVALLLKFISIMIITDRANEVIGLWMIFPFIADINQVREFYATSVAFLGLALFLRIRDERRGLWIATIMIIIASYIHGSNIFYIILLIPYFKKKKLENAILFENNNFIRNYLITIFIISIVVMINSSSAFFAKILSIVGLEDKWMQTVEAASMAYSNKSWYYAEVIVFFIITSLILRHVKLMSSRMLLSYEKLKVINFVVKSNYLLLLLLPLTVFTPDVYRLQQEFAIFVYCVGSYFHDGDILYTKKQLSLNNILLKIFLMVLACVYLYLMCIGIPGTSLKEIVFDPAFYNNLIIK